MLHGYFPYPITITMQQQPQFIARDSLSNFDDFAWIGIQSYLSVNTLNYLPQLTPKHLEDRRSEAQTCLIQDPPDPYPELRVGENTSEFPSSS